MDLYLMQANEKVLQFNIDEGNFVVLNEALLPYSLKGKFKEETNNMSVPELIHTRLHNQQSFMHYLAGRVLNLSRENAKKLLNAYNLSQDTTDEAKARIAITCRAISVTDSYWISDGSLSWEEINPRTTHLNEIVAHIALKGSSFTLEGRPSTPELTGQGAYAKAWLRDEDGLYLYKRGIDSHDNREVDVEVSVSDILDCFNVDHVRYEYADFEGVIMSRCKNMATEELSLVSAEEVYSYCARNEEDFLRYSLSIDSENIMKMCVIDYLISNADRHGKNWGFYKDNATGDLVSCHPLFDHNNAFDIETMNDENCGPSLIFQGKTKKEAAIYAVKRCNLHQIALISKDLFIDDRCFQSFISRAGELGINLKYQCEEIDDQNQESARLFHDYGENTGFALGEE